MVDTFFSFCLKKNRNYSELASLDKALHIVFPFLPLLWIMGILPPLDALFPWLAEQTLVLVLGGSPLATDLRLVNMSWDVDQLVIGMGNLRKILSDQYKLSNYIVCIILHTLWLSCAQLTRWSTLFSINPPNFTPLHLHDFVSLSFQNFTFAEEIKIFTAAIN